MQAPLTFVPQYVNKLRADAKIESAPITSEDFIKLANKKRIYILSVNLEGIGLSRRLRSLGLDVCSFLDTRFVGSIRHQLPVKDPEQFFEMADVERDIIFVCTKDREWKQNFLKRAADGGFKRHHSLFTPLDVCKFFPTIEIEGKCNLQCKTCDMGLPGANKGRGHMTHGFFKEVLTKMIREIPLMNSVALYTWGEPLLNPEIGKIVRECREQGVACEVSSNLDYQKYLEDFLLAEPDQIVAPCAGIKERYERGRTGAKWENYLNGLRRIAEIRDKYKLDYNVRIMYHLYKDNLHEDLDYMRVLSSELGFTLIPIVAHIFPGQVYQYAVNGKNIPPTMMEASEHLIFPLDNQLEHSRSRTTKGCHIINAFPNVAFDGKVLHCCNMQKPSVGSESFIGTPLTDFISQRNASEFCSKCMDSGVHRFFDVNIRIDEVNGVRSVVRL